MENKFLWIKKKRVLPLFLILLFLEDTLLFGSPFCCSVGYVENELIGLGWAIIDPLLDQVDRGRAYGHGP